MGGSELQDSAIGLPRDDFAVQGDDRRLVRSGCLAHLGWPSCFSSRGGLICRCGWLRCWLLWSRFGFFLGDGCDDGVLRARVAAGAAADAEFLVDMVLLERSEGNSANSAVLSAFRASDTFFGDFETS